MLKRITASIISEWQCQFTYYEGPSQATGLNLRIAWAFPLANAFFDVLHRQSLSFNEVFTLVENHYHQYFYCNAVFLLSVLLSITTSRDIKDNSWNIVSVHQVVVRLAQHGADSMTTALLLNVKGSQITGTPSWGPHIPGILLLNYFRFCVTFALLPASQDPHDVHHWKRHSCQLPKKSQRAPPSFFATSSELFLELVWSPPSVAAEPRNPAWNQRFL